MKKQVPFDCVRARMIIARSLNCNNLATIFLGLLDAPALAESGTELSQFLGIFLPTLTFWIIVKSHISDSVEPTSL